MLTVLFVLRVDMRATLAGAVQSTSTATAVRKHQQRLWVRFWSVCIAHTRSKPSTWSFCQIAWQMQRPDLGVISPKMWAVDWPSFSHGCPSEFLSVIALDGIAKLEALKGDW